MQQKFVTDTKDGFFMLHRECKYVSFKEDGGNVIFIWKVFSQCISLS
jgi:hypothetical protein